MTTSPHPGGRHARIGPSPQSNSGVSLSPRRVARIDGVSRRTSPVKPHPAGSFLDQLNRQRACSSCGHECSTGQALLTEGADDSETSMPQAWLILAIGILYVWMTTLSLIYLYSLTVL